MQKLGNCGFKYVSVQDRALKLYPANRTRKGQDLEGLKGNRLITITVVQSPLSMLTLE